MNLIILIACVPSRESSVCVYLYVLALSWRESSVFTRQIKVRASELYREHRSLPPPPSVGFFMRAYTGGIIRPIPIRGISKRASEREKFSRFGIIARGPMSVGRIMLYFSYIELVGADYRDRPTSSACICVTVWYSEMPGFFLDGIARFLAELLLFEAGMDICLAWNVCRMNVGS